MTHRWPRRILICIPNVNKMFQPYLLAMHHCTKEDPKYLENVTVFSGVQWLQLWKDFVQYLLRGWLWEVNRTLRYHVLKIGFQGSIEMEKVGEFSDKSREWQHWNALYTKTDEFNCVIKLVYGNYLMAITRMRKIFMQMYGLVWKKLENSLILRRFIKSGR